MTAMSKIDIRRDRVSISGRPVRPKLECPIGSM